MSAVTIPQSPEKPVVRLLVQSTDVLSDMRVNVLEEGTNRVIWYKERYLSEDEIVENLVENDTSTVVWSIHRPTRGWYIRIRTPAFPPGVFIPLLPVPDKASYYAPAALSFSCRTKVPGPPPTLRSRTQSMETDSTLHDDVSPSANHSYPPTPPPTLSVEPPTPSEVREKLGRIASRPGDRTAALHSSQRTSRITQFYLTPLLYVKQPAVEQSSFFARAMSIFKANTSTDSKSFGLYPVEHIAPMACVPIPSSSTTPLPMYQSSSYGQDNGSGSAPLLTFHDRTSVLIMGSLSGSIEIDQSIERTLGVQRGFWVAIALTYLEFLEERDSYLVAVND